MSPPKIRVKEMPRASLLENDTIVEMEFKGEGGERVVLQFPLDKLDKFVIRAHQLTYQARIRNAAKSGHLELGVEPAAKAESHPAAGGSSVILGVQTTSGYAVHYSIPVAEAEVLQRELTNSISSAKKQSKQTRQ